MKALTVLEADSVTIVETSITATMITVLKGAVLRMIPYCVPVIPLIFLDLYWGIRAAKYRKEKVRTSTALSRSVAKFFKYLCWIVIATTLAIGFEKKWIEWLILGFVYGNEIISIYGNYLETRGLELNMKTLFNWILRIFGQKTNIDTEGMDVGDLVTPKPKPQRDPKTGHFVKNK